MGKPFLKFHTVDFCYEEAVDPLLLEFSLHAATGWTGVAGPNGSGKSTLLRLAAGLLTPGAGRIDRPQKSFYCPQRTDHIPLFLEDLAAARDKPAVLVKGRLGVRDDWPRRWHTLSQGERKRAQLAVALWMEPELLAVDEPGNHLDASAREMIKEALQPFGGVGLLVSHDRDLLDSLCDRCLFLEPPRALLRQGNYTRARAALEEERLGLKRLQENQKKSLKKMTRETHRRKAEADGADKKRSKRGLAKKDHDAKSRIDLARVTGADGRAGRLLRQMDARLERARQALAGIEVKKEYTLGVWLPGSCSPRNYLLHLSAGELSLGGEKKLEIPELYIQPTDRIALTGDNGSGKSTLIRHLLSLLNVPEEHVTYIPQEIELEQSRAPLEQVLSLSHDRLGHTMTVISRLGSRPHRLLESVAPSPGETRKLLLALGLSRLPHIVIMDEPTNHMDLPSIECLEDALADSPCALLLVSHDRAFLERLTRKRWHIAGKPGQAGTYRLHSE